MSVGSIVPPSHSLDQCIESAEQRAIEIMVKEQINQISSVGFNTKIITAEEKARMTTPVLNPAIVALPKTPRLTSREKLDALGHDPLEALVKLNQRLERTLQAMEDIRDGLAPGKFSNEYYCQTLALLQKNNNDLLRYGYARVSETVTVEQKGAPLLAIQLTTAETFKQINGTDEQGDTFDASQATE